MGLELEFDGRPSTAALMLRGLWRAPWPPSTAEFRPIRLRWPRCRPDAVHFAEFLRLTGLRADGELPLLYPHVRGFPLQMVVLTHPAFPVPIWKVLQVRNHILQHAPLAASAELDFDTRVVGGRILGKGLEVDVHTTVRVRDRPVWESLNTYYHRGRFGAAGDPSPLARAPDVGGSIAAEWRTASGVGRRFAALTADHNPLHWWGWYARRFGFREEFHHPQLALGRCLTHLPSLDPARPRRLDAWLKGPVFYDAGVRLRTAADEGGVAFALGMADDERPSIVGRWRSLDASAARLLDERGRPA